MRVGSRTPDALGQGLASQAWGSSAERIQLTTFDLDQCADVIPVDEIAKTNERKCLNPTVLTPADEAVKRTATLKHLR